MAGTNCDNVHDIVVSTTTLYVSSLGTIKGFSFNGKTSQYLGIPYATIPGRFRRPKPVVAWPNNSWDGTKLGPYCPQPPRDFYPIPVPKRPWVEDPSTSEFDCLNLNISVPFPENDPRCAKLPVMVFLHGGAFAYAAGSAGIYDGRKLADISRDEAGTPTIIITINYRLGIFGFLASEELRDYGQKHGERGVGNYGIWDQVEALRWVQRHISSFGGDPTRVTLFGQSAGGVSTNVHLLREEPLFTSAILQSGLLPLCGVMKVSEYQAIYNKTLDVLKIPNNLSAQERLERLLACDSSELTTSMVSVFMVPVVTLALCDDDVLVPSPMPTYDSYHNFCPPAWCSRIMIGDAKHECIIWNKSYRHLTHSYSSILAVASETIGEDASKVLLEQIYSFNHSLSPTELFSLLEKFCTDAMYLSPNFDAMCSYRQCLAYHFDEPSPYDNEWNGLAHHSLENVFIWGLLRDTLPPRQQEQSKRMGRMWLKFARGENPWPAFGGEGNMMIFGEAGASIVDGTKDGQRGYGKWKKVREADLVEQWAKLADQFCVMRKELIDIATEPRPMQIVKHSGRPANGSIGIL